MTGILNFELFQKYLIREVGCNLELLGQRQNGGRGKEEAIAKHEGEAEHEEEEAIDKHEKGEACFTNARLKTLYSLFIW